MIWPFKRKPTEEKSEPTVEPFRHVIYVKDGVKWRYIPARDITAYEVAMISAAFVNPFARVDYIAYFKQHNLMRHFVREEK